MRNLAICLVAICLFVSCESPTNRAVIPDPNDETPTTNTDTSINRGQSALVTETIKSITPLNIKLGKFASDPEHYMLYIKNVLLVPTYSSHYFMTRFNYSPTYRPIEDVFTATDLTRVNSPFDLTKTTTILTPKDEVAITYFIIDGIQALDSFKKHIGFVRNSETPALVSKTSSLDLFQDLTVKDNEVTVICLLEVKAFEVTRNEDIFCENFLNAKKKHVSGLEDQFTQDYGDSSCSKEILGGDYVMRTTFSIAGCNESLQDIRQALLENAKSYFNLEAKKDLSDRTKAVLASVQWTLPYTLGHSASTITWDPAFPTEAEIPSILISFIENMKNPDNIVTLQREFKMYPNATE